MSAAVALCTPASPYDWYWAALDGKNPPLRPQQPECGFFRKPSKDKRTRERIWIPVAVYFDGPDLVAIEGDRTITDFDEIVDLFGWCIKHPVPEDHWRAVVENGEKWPDELPAREVDFSNLPSDPLESILIELQGEKAELEAFLKDGIKRQDEADRAANWKSRIVEIGKRAEEMRKAEKKPHDEAAAAVQKRFKPALELTDELKCTIDAAMTPYLREKARREAEERAQLAAEGQDAPKPKSTKAGTIGRTVALTTVKTGKVVNAEEFSLYLVRMLHPDMSELLDKLANRIARAGATAPGVEILTDQVAR
jgi:hypothetical protein